MSLGFWNRVVGHAHVKQAHRPHRESQEQHRNPRYISKRRAAAMAGVTLVDEDLDNIFYGDEPDEHQLPRKKVCCPNHLRPWAHSRMLRMAFRLREGPVGRFIGDKFHPSFDCFIRVRLDGDERMHE